MVPKKHDEDTKSGVELKIVISIAVICITGWIAWVSTSAILNKENNQKLSGKVDVIETDHRNLKENVAEIKQLVIEIRRDQIRRYGK